MMESIYLRWPTAANHIRLMTVDLLQNDNCYIDFRKSIVENEHLNCVIYSGNRDVRDAEQDAECGKQTLLKSCLVYPTSPIS
jgi:hypothetical protein